MKKILNNLFYLFFPILLGSLVGLLISGNIDYTALSQPPFAPPKILFPIVWSILYLLMGISYFFYRKENDDKKTKIIYYSQLVINLLWSIFFFLLKWRFFSVLWIILLDFFILYLIKLFWEQKKISAYLNIPYLLWSLFATYLTIGIYFLN